ncbi:YCF48-related protein [Runella sp. SP2]|uniref:WD40/YVTN/BNR-like repeat-containing protein n=1 Tax=Runella sp. SP2 TaxID=2268026 RepID=UPI000F0900E1|nr:YCF48-related protein [Runella sp. SP2]AYQ36608.1 hypothetical protein DTQ70_30265 [Runella sp. SP2]
MEETTTFSKHLGLYRYFFVNNTHGWLIGRPSNNGCIATVDGGQTWTAQNLPTNNFNDLLHNVYFINPLEGWIVGANGIILKTTDGGNNWIRKTSNTNYRLINVHFLNSQQGCAVGENGIILTTSDGGESWVKQKSNTTERFLSVQYTTSLTVWAAGDNLYKTTNGGETWLKQSIEPVVVNSFKQIQFQDEYNGWILGSVDAFFTNDGGIKWSKAPHLANPKKIHFYSPTEVWIVGNNIMKFQSVNGCPSDLVAIPVLTGPTKLQTVNSGNWESPASWNCGIVPTVTQDVIIKSSHRININPLYPANCKNLYIESGAVLNCPTGSSFEAKSWN